MNEMSRWAPTVGQPDSWTLWLRGGFQSVWLSVGIVALMAMLCPGASLAKTLLTIEKHAEQTDPWDVVRTEQVEPLSAMLHHHSPDLIEERDLETLLRFYATERGDGLGWANFEPYETDSEPMMRSARTPRADA